MHPHSDTHRHAQRGFVAILTAALLWGTVGITTQAIYQVTPTTALSIGFLRLSIATPALLVACWQARLRLFPIPWRDFARMLGIGVTMALYQVCFLGAIPYYRCGQYDAHYPLHRTRHRGTARSGPAG